MTAPPAVTEPSQETAGGTRTRLPGSQFTMGGLRFNRFMSAAPSVAIGRQPWPYTAYSPEEAAIPSESDIHISRATEPISPLRGPADPGLDQMRNRLAADLAGMRRLHELGTRLATEHRSEEHTSELKSPIRLSYAALS